MGLLVAIALLARAVPLEPTSPMHGHVCVSNLMLIFWITPYARVFLLNTIILELSVMYNFVQFTELPDNTI